MSERVHFVSHDDVPLSLQELSFDQLEQGLFGPCHAEVRLHQHYRETAPHVWLGISGNDLGWDLTVEEADALAGLLHATTRLVTPVPGAADAETALGGTAPGETAP